MSICVFCGSETREKTKEHIIPKWLIEKTGPKNRIINLGLNYNKLFSSGEEKYIQFSFDKFTFPACESCNEKYGQQLEGKTKSVFEKIEQSTVLSKDEIMLLLDWFDKVRIGLWLEMLSLNKNYAGIHPKFHIDKRIALHDRTLFVYRAESPAGINFFGVSSPLFSCFPSCFTLRVNNYFF